MFAELRKRARGGKVTVVFAARDAEHSNAAALAPLLGRRLHKPYLRRAGP